MNRYLIQFSEFSNFVGAFGMLALAVATATGSPARGEAGRVKVSQVAVQQADESRGATPAVSAPASDENMPPKANLPSQAAVRAAMARLEDVFGRDIARASSPDEQVAVSKKLAAASDKVDERAEKWALLSESLRLAMQAGSLDDVDDIIERLVNEFGVDGHGFRVDALSKMAAKPSPLLVETLAMACLKEAQHAVAIKSYGSAAQVSAAGQRLARRTRNLALVNQFTEISQQVRVAEKRDGDLRSLLAKHDAEPNNAKVCLALGTHYCFEQSDWTRGMPLLVKGEDPPLAELAAADSVAGTDPKKLVAAADNWVAWARKQRGAPKAAGLGRATELYGKTLKKLHGLEQISVQKKLEELVKAEPSSGAASWLADLKPLRTGGFNIGFNSKGTYLDKPYTCGGESCEKSLLVMPTGGMNPGSAVYAVPPSTKRLVGAAGIFMQDGPMNTPKPQFFEIKVDGQTVWKSSALSKANAKEPFDVVVAGGSEVELISMSERADSAFATWVNPRFVK